MWLRATGADQVDPNPGPHLSSAELAIQAAIAGQGVALSSTALIADDLKAGRLVIGGVLSSQLVYSFFKGV